MEVGTYLILTSVDAEATRAHTHTLTHALRMCCDSSVGSCICGGVTWANSELLRQEIPLSSPGTPRCLMPASATEPGLSPRLRLSHGSRIESLILPHQTTHTHKTFFCGCPLNLALEITINASPEEEEGQLGRRIGGRRRRLLHSSI